MSELVRYSEIQTKLKREFLLLQGLGCKWKKCLFCDYYSDVSADPYAVNQVPLGLVTGKHGVLDIINSGSAMELDPRTIAQIQKIVFDKKIHTLWFEANYLYRNKLTEFAKLFAPATVKFRCGIETFDGPFRQKLQKGIAPEVTPRQVAAYFRGVCLLCCLQGQTKEMILNDIRIAGEYFEYFSVNLFCNNTTPVKRDEQLVTWFYREVYPKIKDDDKIEILGQNTDLGVG